MKVSTKVECGIVALLDIALYEEEGKPVTVSSISNRQNLSIKYLEQILIVLRQAHLVRGMKGSKGGYVLTCSPKQITLRNVMDAMDVTMLSDVSDQKETTESTLKDVVRRQLWNPMTAYLQQFCDSITLFDLMEQYRIVLSNAEGPMYYI